MRARSRSSAGQRAGRCLDGRTRAGRGLTGGDPRSYHQPRADRPRPPPPLLRRHLTTAGPDHRGGLQHRRRPGARRPPRRPDRADLRHPQVCRHLLLPHSGAGLTSVLARRVPGRRLHPAPGQPPRRPPAEPLRPARRRARLPADVELRPISGRFDVVLAGAPARRRRHRRHRTPRGWPGPPTARSSGPQGRTTRTQLARAEQAITAANGRLIGTLLTVGERRRRRRQAGVAAATPEGTPSRPVRPHPGVARACSRHGGPSP